MRIAAFCCSLMLLVCSAHAADAPRRLHLLFLGDNGHHVPLERLRQVQSHFSRHGIELHYTDQLSDLNPRKLAHYDGVLLYANHTRITPDQEKALLDFVASGKGFVPVHCASACFGNSKAVIELIGARFQKHGTGVFKETIVKPDHPVMRGYAPFESWDETYVHSDHNQKDRELLTVRVEGEHKEPWTWARTHGKGRVFYTAWGHDQRTWGQAGFLDLLERGIRWSCGDWAMGKFPEPGPFTYVDGDLPDYITSARGQKGALIKKVQQPLSPADSMNHTIVAPEFAVSLFASDPQIKKPVCMTWDERGRLWIAETFDYPNNLAEDGVGNDRITVVEDTNSDGVADKFSVFADRLSIPTSMIHANGGLIVTMAPHTIFLKDTDGDGKADVRKVLFTGWGTGDTHAGPSNLRYGFDNWIYGTVGYSAYKGTAGGKELSFRQGAFRFKPDGSALEFLGSTTNNTWGLGVSEEGHWFISTANAAPSFHLHIPNRYYESVRGLSVPRLDPIMDTNRFWTPTDKIRQVDVHGGYTAAAGHALYTARAFPQSWWNRVALVAEPTGHLLGKFQMISEGTAFKARNEFNLLSSTDEWAAPIMAEVGPDSAVWMIDWYNIIVQHNPIPPGFKKGKGNAYETDLRDKRHGRIHRITWKDAPAISPTTLAGATPQKLVDTLRNDNLLWRQHAQRLLVERGQKDVIPALIQLTRDTSVDAVGINAGAIHALWTLQGLGALDGSNAEATAAVVASLGHAAPGVRKNALEVLPRTAAARDAIFAAKLLDDPHPQVRKSALLALSEVPADEASGKAVFAMLQSPANNADKWIADAAIVAGARHDAGFLKAALAAYVRKDGGGGVVQSAAANLIRNPSFEEGAGTNPTAWRVRHYNGRASQEWVDGGRTGNKALKLSSTTGSDTSWFIDVPVEPNAEYRLSAWIKTQDLKGATGALLNIHNLTVRTPAVTGTSDWKQVSIEFNSRDRQSLSINCLFGGWGQSTGVAWYDDIELTRTSGPSLPGPVGRAVAVVTNHYAHRGPAESVVGTLLALGKADEQLSYVMLSALADSWPAGAEVKLSESEAKQIAELAKALPAASRDKLINLAGRWGRAELFKEELAGAIKQLLTELNGRRTPPAKKIDAARRLVEMDDTLKNVQAILKQIDATFLPDQQVAMLEAAAASKSPEAGVAIVKRWKSFSPTAQRAAMSLLLRRGPWTVALLDGLEDGSVDNRDLKPEQWEILTNSRDKAIAERSRKLQKSTGRAPNPDKAKLHDALAPLVRKKGDITRGKEIYLKNCAVCHAIDGEGGKVGPDLTGIGVRTRSDLLLEILDPNRSVEGTYRQWTVETKTEILYGRLMAESQTSIEIIDPEGKTHTFARKDIAALTAGEKSVMPEGFESIGAEGLADLLEFIEQSKVKH